MRIVRFFRILLLLCSLGLSVSGCTDEYARLQEHYFPYLFAKAEQLGYTPAALLAQGDHCTSDLLLGGLCSIFVIYKTPLDVNAFGTLLPGLGLEQKGYELSDGGGILDTFKFDLKRKVTRGDNGGDTVEDWIKLKEFPDHTWSFVGPEEKYLAIHFFEIAALDPPLALDGQPIQDNMVMVKLILGNIQFVPPRK